MAESEIVMSPERTDLFAKIKDIVKKHLKEGEEQPTISTIVYYMRSRGLDTFSMTEGNWIVTINSNGMTATIKKLHAYTDEELTKLLGTLERLKKKKLR